MCACMCVWEFKKGNVTGKTLRENVSGLLSELIFPAFAPVEKTKRHHLAFKGKARRGELGEKKGCVVPN